MFHNLVEGEVKLRGRGRGISVLHIYTTHIVIKRNFTIAMFCKA